MPSDRIGKRALNGNPQMALLHNQNTVLPMPESILCPRCRRLLQAPAGYEGRELRCSECQKVFVAATGTEITAAAPRSAPPASAPPASAIEPCPPPHSPPAPPPLPRYADESDDELAERLAVRRLFKPGGGLALSARLLLGLNLFLYLVLLVSNSFQYSLALRLIAGENIAFAELDSNDRRQQALAILHYVVHLTAGIVFLIWFYRVHANLKHLGARDLAYSSGWAVGYWFVPILNLFRPVQVAQEIWRNSDPDAVLSDGAIEPTFANSPLIGFWWAMWLISGLLEQIASGMSRSVNSPESLRSMTVGSMIADVARMIACVLVLAVVSAIDARQTARAEALSGYGGVRHEE
jgi:LSD1 subclass zinc finger protein